MATLAEVESASDDLNSLWVILAAEVASESSGVLNAPPDVAAGLLRDLATELAEEFGQAASLVMAEFYEELRPLGGFDTTLATPDLDALQRNVGWSTRELFNAEPDPKLVASLTAEVTELAAADTARMTIIENARRDPLDVRYSRHASATACAFCAMLATRQAVYRSQDDAGFKSHRSCHCLAVPIFPGDEVEEPDYVAEWRETYYAARKSAADGSASSILSQMRRIGGLR